MGRQLLVTFRADEALSSAPCGFLRTGADGTILWINETLCSWLGYAAVELAGRRKLQELLTSGGRIFQQTHWFPLLQMQGAVFEVKLELVSQDGRQIPMLINARRYSSDGQVVDDFALFVAHDRDKYERELVAAKRKLQESDERKDEFLAMLAHELRNPLAPITSAAHVLSSGRLDAQRAKTMASIIARQSEHMTALIDELLDVSRVTRGKITVAKEPVDLKTVVADAVEQAKPLLEKHKHDFSLHLSNDVSIVDGDRARLVQIVANLLNNAAKYTPDGGSIGVSLDVFHESLAITVADNGMGRSGELLAKAFELFAQGDRSVDRRQGGLGIGLALARSLAVLHGGSLIGHSDGPGAGSTFTLTLPRKQDGLALARASNDLLGEEAQTRTAALRIAVVDDNRDAAVALSLILETCGHKVVVFHSGNEAMQHLTPSPPDVAILDIGMPGMDGFELARRLRDQPETAGSVLLALTGYGQAADREKALAAGFDHHLVKPVNLEQLERLLQDIAHHRGLRELHRVASGERVERSR